MKKGKFTYSDIASIQAEIKRQIGYFRSGRKRAEFATMDFKDGGKWMKGSFKAEPESQPAVSRSSYRGVTLDQVVAGMKVIEDWVMSSSFSDKEAQ
jgi:hypothetical protein